MSRFVFSSGQCGQGQKQLKPYETEYDINSFLVCYMEFRMASKLKNHEKIHIYETPHTCSMPNCGLIFKTEAECKQHEESHNQRFKCEICGKQLASEKVNI